SKATTNTAWHIDDYQRLLRNIFISLQPRIVHSVTRSSILSRVS
ncbi:uncharacterized protein HMPREF1541_05248, partial [Cyphellophora europaea CBS 101466]